MPTADQIIFTDSAGSETPLTPAQRAALFPDVSNAQAAAGLVDRANVYIRNLSTADDPLVNATVNIEIPTTSDDTKLRIAITDVDEGVDDAVFYGIGDMTPEIPAVEPVPPVPAVPPGPPTSVTFGSPTQRVSVGQSVGAVVVDGDVVYVIGRGTFRRYNISDFTEITPRRNLDPGNTNPFGVTHDDTYIYVQQSGSNRCFRYRKSDHQVSRQQLNAADNGSRGMAVDEDHFYSQPNDTTVYVYDRSWNFEGTINLSGLGSVTRTSIHADDNFLYFSNYGNGTIMVVRKRLPTGGGSISLASSDILTTSSSIVPNRINGLDIVGDTAYFTRDAPTNGLFTVPVTYSGATPGTPAVPGIPGMPRIPPMIALPLSLGNFVGTRRLWIERTVDAGAGFTEVDMSRITVRENPDGGTG